MRPNSKSLGDLKESYTEFHQSHNPSHVYPTEWVIRTMLGSYPHLTLDKSHYTDGKILDIGFGDGRNWSLLNNIGLQIYGVEITDQIVALGQQRAKSLGLSATLRVGTNSNIPFADNFFDYILAAFSCYYVDAGTKFDDTLSEYARVLKPGGYLLATLPEAGTCFFEGGKELPGGLVEIHNDPWGLRNGYLFRCFNSRAEIRETFSALFDCFSIGLCSDDYYGFYISFYLLVCRKKP